MCTFRATGFSGYCYISFSRRISLWLELSSFHPFSRHALEGRKGGGVLGVFWRKHMPHAYVIQIPFLFIIAFWTFENKFAEENDLALNAPDIVMYYIIS